MPRPFSMATILRRTPYKMLRWFMPSIGLDLGIDWKNLHAYDIPKVIAAYETISQEEQLQFEEKLKDLFLLIDKEGIAALREAARLEKFTTGTRFFTKTFRLFTKSFGRGQNIVRHSKKRKSCCSQTVRCIPSNALDSPSDHHRLQMKYWPASKWSWSGILASSKKTSSFALSKLSNASRAESMLWSTATIRRSRFYSMMNAKSCTRA